MFILPSSFIDDIEKMINAFWWGCGGNNSRGIRWLSWVRLACPKAKGGMGFCNFEAFNIAMVAKQGGSNIRIMTGPWLRGVQGRWVNASQNEGPVVDAILEVPLFASVHEDKLVWEDD
ncbi:putative ribonuclease H protein, partial [Trifolium medium]|nr:putative ribonuclease H protein [Trifolium medium]